MKFTFPTALILAASAQLASATWWDSCDHRSVWISNYYLNADCYQRDGTLVHQAIDLTSCIGNFNGLLRCANWGNFGASCNNCNMSGPTLQCNCRNDAGGWVAVEVNTGDCIDNFDGQLGCFGHLY